MSDDLKDRIFEVVQNAKKKYLLSELARKFPEDDKRAVKKAVQEMIADGRLEYWSSGSTTYISLPWSKDAHA
ncbi:MAG: dissimilatory sulfite reductase-asociated protein DsvD [Deltaproteobacteria bacterium]|nr:dissimilatory sulfite reductase-asociated protein DsvD [Deltaproteobacteria bacterium]